jgi:membrane fusion protein (multidrug efflux system)
MKRYLFLLLLGTAACNSAGAAPQPTGAKTEPPAADAVRVETAVLEKSKASLQITLPGEIEGHRDATLQAAPGGLIESVHVKAGDRVRRGQLLVRVDTATQSARLDQTAVELSSAERELRRAQDLSDVIPKAELDAAETRWRAAKAAIGSQRVSVARSVVTAPFAGVAVRVDAEAGEVAGPGVPLVRVVQLDPVKVTVSLSDRDVVALREGMKAKVRVNALSGVFEGTVKRLHRAADLSTRAFTAEVEIPNPNEDLLPGMIASVTLDAQFDGKGLVISQDWLVTGIQENGVFVDDNGVAKWRPVELGPILRDQVLVTKGLHLGDRLVINGHRELADGDPLLVSRHGTCCTNGRVRFD